MREKIVLSESNREKEKKIQKNKIVGVAFLSNSLSLCSFVVFSAQVHALAYRMLSIER